MWLSSSSSEEQKKELERQVEQLLIESVSGRHQSAGRQQRLGASCRVEPDWAPADVLGQPGVA